MIDLTMFVLQNYRKGLLNRLMVYLVLMGCSLATWAQHIAPATDNYKPTHSVLINPASIADPKPYLDFRFAGVSAQAENNFYYLPNANLGAELVTNLQEGKKYHGAVNADVYGPALAFAVKHRSFGFNIRMRNMAYAKNIPEDIAGFIKNGLFYPAQHGQRYEGGNYHVKFMSWGEIGLNYAQIVRRRGNRIISAGGSLKILSGITHVGFMADKMAYEVDTLNVYTAQTKAKAALTVPGFNKGLGAGVDLGVQYKKMLSDNNDFHIPHSPERGCEVKDYKYKIGVSIIDLGLINFKKDSQFWKFDEDSLYWNDYQNNKASGITPINALLGSMSSATGAQPEQKSKYLGYLPLTLGAQFDYNFENNFFINGNLELGLHQRVVFGTERVSKLTITPRYERKRITAALPVTIFRHQLPGLGVYARIYFLSFGVNNLIPLALKQDMYGADFYFSLNWQLIHSKPCREYFTNRKNYCPKPKLKLFDFKQLFNFDKDRTKRMKWK